MITWFLKAIAVLLIATPCFADYSGFTYRRALTIDHTKVSTQSLTYADFPVYFSTNNVTLSTSSGGGRLTNVNSYDIVFSTHNDCSYLLNWGTQTINTSGIGVYSAWVKIPEVSSTTDTTFYTCYGNASVSSFLGNSTSTWDSNYVGVWHMDDNEANLVVAESTVYASTAANSQNTNTRSIAGPVGNALQYQAGDGPASIIKASPYDFTTEDYSVEMWWRPTIYQQYSVFIGNLQYPVKGWYFQWASAGRIQAVSLYGTYRLYLNSYTGFSVNNWYHLTFTRTGTSWKWYLNGSPAGSNTNYANATSSAGNTLRFGSENASAADDIDEIRISNSARSYGWIQTSYNNQSSPSTFITFGDEETSAPPESAERNRIWMLN